ncbi:surface-adhesin E family protein [Paraburkholderia sediminicola]|uniref:surface-adhesin E family protein n=1 Tax=Paraburkholderia sediminicola TaxID=458836 RepID=UPI0038B7DE1E
MVFKVPVVCLLAACLAGTASASDWIYYGKKGKTSLAVDLESAEFDIPAKTGKAWVRIEFKPPKLYGTKKIASVMSHEEVDCDSRKLATLQTVGYDASGSVVISSDTPGKMETQIPDTTGEATVEAICLALQAQKASDENTGKKQ